MLIYAVKKYFPKNLIVSKQIEDVLNSDKIYKKKKVRDDIHL